jgi:hypothetical protein
MGQIAKGHNSSSLLPGKKSKYATYKPLPGSRGQMQVEYPQL